MNSSTAAIETWLAVRAAELISIQGLTVRSLLAQASISIAPALAQVIIEPHTEKAAKSLKTVADCISIPEMLSGYSIVILRKRPAFCLARV